jgi:hypothetical protein
MYQFQAATCSSMLDALVLIVVLFMSPQKVVRPETFGTTLVLPLCLLFINFRYSSLSLPIIVFSLLLSLFLPLSILSI